MDDGLTGLLGIARKAGKAQAGEEPAAAAATAHKARLLLLAADAADNTAKKTARLGETGNCPVARLSLTKEELGGALGRSSCAVVAITDVGLAAALVKKLAAADPGQYGALGEQLDKKAEKTLRRRREQREKEKAAQKAKSKPWAAPPRQN